MTHVEGHLPGARSLRLFWQGWRPTSASGVVVIAHGLAEHGGRYARLAEALVAEGYAVYALDHRGHGRSDGRRAFIERFDDLVSDLDRLVREVERRHPLLKPVLFGHSLGGAIALRYAAEQGPRLRGLALSGPAVQLHPAPAWQIWLGRGLSRLWPSLPFYRIDAGAVSRDPDEVRRYDEDPLNTRRPIPVRTVVEIYEQVQRLPQRYRDLRLPLLVMHGTADRLALPEGSERLMREAGSADRRHLIYEGYFHELLNEPPAERTRVTADLVSWLRALDPGPH